MKSKCKEKGGMKILSKEEDKVLLVLMYSSNQQLQSQLMMNSKIYLQNE
jgi:hypothetical protein